MGVIAPRVLIADGDVGLRQQLFSALLSLDVFSDSVGNAADALIKLAEDRYAVIVVDVSLHGDGVDHVIGHVARMPVGDRPVVLVLAMNPEAARSLDVEIVQIVLRKPVNLPQLVDVVRSCVRNTRARGEANLGTAADAR
jgi:DNA-binding response OmpR family regulator